MKLWHKFLVAPAVGVLLIATTGGVAVLALRYQQASTDGLIGNQMEKKSALQEVRVEVAQVHSYLYRQITVTKASDDAAALNSLRTEVQKKISAVRERTISLDKAVMETSDDSADPLEAKFNRYRNAADVALDMLQVDVAIAVSSMQKADASFQELNKHLTLLSERQSRRVEAETRQVAARIRTIQLAMAGLCALALVLTVATGLVMARQLVRPVRNAALIAQRIAQGDLCVQFECQSDDEVGDLMRALRGMVTQLSSIISRIQDTAGAVKNASSEIAGGNLELSGRTERQAAHLKQAAQSLHALTESVRQNAGASVRAEDCAKSASGVALEGGTAVADVVSTMQAIDASSKKIAEILGVIDAIAFQTNILALNAAVEAARAGEGGRGFAVVAGEVRTLAHRSAEAAKEIKTLITENVVRVQAGTRLVDGAGQTMQGIVEAVKRVTDIIEGISGATTRQSHELDQFNASIHLLDDMTQQNAALVEESAAASEVLNRQAQGLSQAACAFHLQAAS